MPTTAYIGFLFLFLQHQRDLGITLMRQEKPVDVDRAKAAGKGDMVIFGQRLIAEEDDAVIGIGLPDRLELSVRQLADVDACYLCACALQGCDLHVFLPARSLDLWRADDRRVNPAGRYWQLPCLNRGYTPAGFPLSIRASVPSLSIRTCFSVARMCRPMSAMKA